LLGCCTHIDIIPVRLAERMSGMLPNAALVTKTSLADAARAIEDPASLTLASFFDLCSVLEASVLLDQLQAIESPDALPDARLTAELRRRGILIEFQPSISRTELRRLVLRLPEELYTRMLPTFWEQAEEPDGSLVPHGGDDERAAGVTDQTGALNGIDYTAGLDALLRQVDQMIDIHSLKNDVKERALRSNGYLVVAAANGLDYFPDYDRMPFVLGTVRALYRSLPIELYQRIAKSLGESLHGTDVIAEWTLDATLPIPPISAIVLHRANTLDEVPEKLLEVRSELTGYRAHFATFKAELHNVEDARSRARLLKKYRALLETASGPNNDVMSVTEMLNLAQNMVMVAAAPQLPTSYAAALVIQPLDWIRRWWARRPLVVLFRLDGKLPRISEYRGLISKHWGQHADEQLLEDAAAHPAAIRRLLDQS
jgi:hypothetical protein